MPNNQRRSFDSGLAPQEVGGEMKQKKAETEVEEGAARDVSESSEAKALRLFSALEVDLKRRKQEAKAAGQDPKAIKGFDKSSNLYKDYILAYNENQLAALKKRESKFQAEIEKIDAEGKDVPESLYQNWLDATQKISQVSMAKRVRAELSRSIDNTAGEIESIGAKAEILGVEDPAMTAEVARLEGEANVVKAQLSVVDNIAVGAEVVEQSAPIPVSSLEGATEDALEDYMGEVVPELSFDFVSPSKSVEISGSNKGVDQIKSFFSKELSRDAKAKIGFREQIFHAKLNQFVGGDEDFADLLLKNINFRKAAQNLFDTKIGVFANKELEAAAQFVFVLEQARSFYDQIKAKREAPETVGAEEEVEAVEEVVEASVEQPSAMGGKIKSAQDYFDGFKKFGIESPKGLEVRMNNLTSDMLIQKANLEMLQAELKSVSLSNPLNWFNPRALTKRNELQSQIKDTQNEIADLKEILMDLGVGIVENTKIYSETTLAKFNSELADQLKQLRAAKVDSKDFFDKYSDVAMTMLIITTAALTVASVGRDRHFNVEKSTEKPAAIKMIKGLQTDADTGGMSQVRPDDSRGFTPASDLSVEPKEIPWGGMSGETESGFTTAEGYTPTVVSETEEAPRARNGKGKKVEKPAIVKPETKAVDFSNYGDKLEDFDKKIQVLRDQVKQLVEEAEPVDLDNDVSLKKAKANNELVTRKRAELDDLTAKRDAFSLAYHQDQISKEAKIREAAPMVKMSPSDRIGYDSLDFSREYVGKLGTAHDVVREIQELAPVANASKRAEFVKKANSAIVQTEMFMGQKGVTKEEITEAKKVREVLGAQYRALVDSLPEVNDVVSLAERVVGDVGELTKRFTNLVGSSKDGVQVFGALEKMQLIVSNVLSTKEISNKDKTELRQMSVDLNSLLKGKNLTSGERTAASQLVQSAGVLLQGVPKSDKLWDIPSGRGLDRASQLGLEQGINKEAQAIMGARGVANTGDADGVHAAQRQDADRQMEERTSRENRINELGLTRDSKGNLINTEGQKVDDRGTPLSE